MATLDTEKADRRMWLVRVPPYIAERWKAACGLAPASGGGGSAQQQPNANANGSDSDGGDDDGGAGGGASLGRVTITTLRDGTTRTVLELPESAAAAGLPLRYTLQPAAGAPDARVLSAERPWGGAAAAAQQQQQPQQPRELTRPRVDGVVSVKYDAVPAAVLAAGGGGGGSDAAGLSQQQQQQSQQEPQQQQQLDGAYRALSRKRTLAAAQRGRAVAVIDDGRAAQRLYQSQHGRNELYVRRTAADRELEAAAAARSARELQQQRLAKRRVRLERGELEQLLFRLFERQARWAFPALQRETDQPAPWLREVLVDIAAAVKRGPHRDLWELQPQFKEAALAAAAAAAAAGQAAGQAAGGDGGAA